jgi:hypothetical protein
MKYTVKQLIEDLLEASKGDLEKEVIVREKSLDNNGTIKDVKSRIGNQIVIWI